MATSPIIQNVLNTPPQVDEIRTFITVEGNVTHEISEEKLAEFTNFIKWYDNEQNKLIQGQGWQKLLDDIAQKDKLIAEQAAQIKALIEGEEDSKEIVKAKEELKNYLDYICDYPMYDVESNMSLMFCEALEDINYPDLRNQFQYIMSIYRIQRYIREKSVGLKS